MSRRSSAIFRNRDPLTASTSAAGASTGARNARRKRPPPAANPHRPNSHRCNHVLTLTHLTGVVATRAECAQRVQFEWCAARAAREACGVRAACTARGLGGPRAGGGPLRPRFGPFAGLSSMVGGRRLCQMFCFTMGCMLICVVRVSVVVRKSRFSPSPPLGCRQGRWLEGGLGSRPGGDLILRCV